MENRFFFNYEKKESKTRKVEKSNSKKCNFERRENNEKCARSNGRKGGRRYVVANWRNEKTQLGKRTENKNGACNSQNRERQKGARAMRKRHSQSNRIGVCKWLLPHHLQAVHIRTSICGNNNDAHHITTTIIIINERQCGEESWKK